MKKDPINTSKSYLYNNVKNITSKPKNGTAETIPNNQDKQNTKKANKDNLTKTNQDNAHNPNGPNKSKKQLNKRDCPRIARPIETIKTKQPNPRTNSHNQDSPAFQTNP